MGENVCPVCGYDGLYDPAFDERGVGSDELCPYHVKHPRVSPRRIVC